MTRIGMVQGGFMVATAAAIDFAQFITKFFHAIPAIGNLAALFVGWFLTVVALTLFWLWFRLNGVEMMEGNMVKGLLYGGTGVVEAVPLINALPAWTLYASAMLVIVAWEDKKREVKEKLSKSTRIAAQQAETPDRGTLAA